MVRTRDREAAMVSKTVCYRGGSLYGHVWLTLHTYTHSRTKENIPIDHAKFRVGHEDVSESQWRASVKLRVKFLLFLHVVFQRRI